MTKKRYQFINLTDWVKIVKIKRKIKKKYVILTFDDGLKNVVINAYPIMKKIGAKGCLYITSGIIDKNQLLWGDFIDVFIRNHSKNNSIFNFIYKGQKINYNLKSERNINNTIGEIKAKLRDMSIEERNSHLNLFKVKNNIQNFEKVPEDYLIANWKDLILLKKEILEIGGHTRSHPNLEFLNDEKYFYKELYGSKLKIENKIGYPIKHFAYPGGYYNKFVIHYVKKYDYLTAVTVQEGFNSINTDLFELKRFNIKNDFLLFKFKISGLYNFLLKYFNIDIG
ncbi:MAG: polysaccharide deacetylase family protein [Promethearchaeota archaeon]